MKIIRCALLKHRVILKKGDSLVYLLLRQAISIEAYLIEEDKAIKGRWHVVKYLADPTDQWIYPVTYRVNWEQRALGEWMKSFWLPGWGNNCAPGVKMRWGVGHVLDTQSWHFVLFGYLTKIAICVCFAHVLVAFAVVRCVGCHATPYMVRFCTGTFKSAQFASPISWLPEKIRNSCELSEEKEQSQRFDQVFGPIKPFGKREAWLQRTNRLSRRALPAGCWLNILLITNSDDYRFWEFGFSICTPTSLGQVGLYDQWRMSNWSGRSHWL